MARAYRYENGRPTPPDRSLEQRRTALMAANLIRTHRKDVKRDLAAGRLDLFALFDDELCQGMKIHDALVHVPVIGRVKASRILNSARINPSKTFGGATARQRHELRLAIAEISPGTDRRLATLRSMTA
jgi:hypothetical protein